MFMDIFSAVVILICVWWIVWFMALPFGNAPEKEIAVGHAGSAPANPRLGLKFAWATGVAVVIWAVIMVMIHTGFFDFQAMADKMAAEDLARHPIATDAAPQENETK
jgi:predicted secreted protein